MLKRVWDKDINENKRKDVLNGNNLPPPRVNNGQNNYFCIKNCLKGLDNPIFIRIIQNSIMECTTIKDGIIHILFGGGNYESNNIVCGGCVFIAFMLCCA